ncbi:uncharacterized protein LOC144378832 isoform X3 [Halichoerus grypus]
MIIKTVLASRSFRSIGMLRKTNTVPFGLLLWVLWSRPFGLMQENTKLFRLKFIIFPSNNDQLLLPSMIRDSVKVPAPSHFDFEIKHRVSPMKWR